MRGWIGAIVLGLATTASAGGWVSGGAELIGDAQNPWFLQNTEEVRYCIAVDEQNFGVSTAAVRVQLERAFGFWKKQFAGADPGSTLGLRVGTQRFVEEPCPAPFSDVDLANAGGGPDKPFISFQFGVLTSEQETYLERPSSYAGIAVRTDYRWPTLHGRGFVYISPERGRLAFQDSEIHPTPWELADGSLLGIVLVHELGHVFGLQHETMETVFIMDPWIIRFVLHRDIAPQVEGGSFDGMPPVFDGNGVRRYIQCSDNPIGESRRVLLGLPAGARCLSIRPRAIGGSDRTYDVYGMADETAPAVHAATISPNGLRTSSGTKPIHVRLKAEQQVVPPVPDGRVEYLYNVAVTRFAGLYQRDADKEGMLLVAKVSPTGFEVDIADPSGRMELEVISADAFVPAGLDRYRSAFKGTRRGASLGL